MRVLGVESLGFFFLWAGKCGVFVFFKLVYIIYINEILFFRKNMNKENCFLNFLHLELRK